MKNIDHNKRTAHSFTPAVSERIELLRLILISGLLWVHLPPAIPGMALWADHLGFTVVLVFLRDVVFMSTVPMLSVISGYLFASSTRTLPQIIAVKFRTILIPFLFWNLPLFFVVVILQSKNLGLNFGTQFFPVDPRTWLNASLSLSAPPMNAPLYFLRDLFVCFCLGPVLRWMIVRGVGLAVLVVLLLGLVFQFETWILVREIILFWFFLGIWLRHFPLNMKAMDGHWKPVLFLYLLAAIIITQISVSNPEWRFRRAATDVLQILGLPMFWVCTGRFMRSALSHRMARLTGMSFFLYCAHSPLQLASWYGVAVPLSLGVQDPVYAIYALISIPLIFGLIYLSWRIMGKACPSFLALITGGRG